MPTLRSTWYVQLAVAASLTGALSSRAMAQELAWKSSAVLERALQDPVGITWHDRGLRDGLARLSRETGTAVFLDRRLDPDQLLSLEVAPVPLETLLDQIATIAKGQTSRIGAVVYVGPPETADELATVAALARAQVARLPPERRSKLQSLRPLKWQELAEPRQLVEQLCREAGVQIDHLEQVPHDLWPAVELPPLVWSDRLTLVLAGFGLTFDLDTAGSAVKLKSIASGNVLERRYKPAGSTAALVPQLRRVLPRSDIRVEQRELVVLGRQEDHEQMERLLAGQPIRSTKSGQAKAPPSKSTKGAGELLFTLTVSGQPAGAVARKVAESLGKQLVYDESVLEKLKTPVTLDLKDATVELLLDRTLVPLGLTYRLTEKELVVSLAP